MKVGAHLWIDKGILKTIQDCDFLKCDCFQIFSHSPRNWEFFPREKELTEEFKQEVKKRKIKPIIVHASYLINLAVEKKEIKKRTLKLLEREIVESKNLGADYYVIHPGFHKGSGIKKGWDTVCENIKDYIEEIFILFENTSGAGTSLGSKFEEFLFLIEKFDKKVGICFDTAHAFQAGYDIKKKFDYVMEGIEKFFSLGYILLIHANDSGVNLGLKLDRHQHIGKGYIGIEGFENLIKNEYFGNLPYIIETPKETLEQDRENIEILRKIGKKYGKI